MFDILSLLAQVETKIRPPVGIILGSPHQAADLVARLSGPDLICYQLDLYQADRLREQIAEIGLDARVEVLPDLWDLPATFNTLVFPNNVRGERELKLDLLEQSLHILRPGGMLLSLSEYQTDQLLPKWHKKIFGKCSELPPTRKGSIFWSIRDGERPRRRHEVTFHARVGEGPSHSFISRPGVFSYGCMDNGARALVECVRFYRATAFSIWAAASGRMASWQWIGQVRRDTSHSSTATSAPRHLPRSMPAQTG